MVEVIVTIVVPADVQHVGSGGGGLSVEPARTEVYRLEFEDESSARAYLVASKHGIDVRDDDRCTNFEQLVGRTMEDFEV